MPWAKLSDGAATHPKVMRVDTLADAEDYSLNEVFGFLMRAAVQSANHLTDYVLDYATAKMLGNGRHDLLLDQAQRAGLLAKPRGQGRQRTWKIIDDPTLLHIRLRDEVEWERQRDRDRKNPALTMPVRARDGSACRYCRHVVDWRDHRGGRGGTFDHRDAGEPGTTETLVVACRSCNSKRKNRPDADEFLPLLPVPAEPYFHPADIKVLARHGFHVKSGPRPDPIEIRWEPAGDSPETQPVSPSPEGGIPDGSGPGSGRVGKTGGGPRSGRSGRQPGEGGPDASS